MLLKSAAPKDKPITFSFLAILFKLLIANGVSIKGIILISF
tara:strand:- start:1689 stop:1811 length:123 start_codon:yes stop_codon:yes gene_type:complete